MVTPPSMSPLILLRMRRCWRRCPASLLRGCRAERRRQLGKDRPEPIWCCEQVFMRREKRPRMLPAGLMWSVVIAVAPSARMRASRMCRWWVGRHGQPFEVGRVWPHGGRADSPRPSGLAASDFDAGCQCSSPFEDRRRRRASNMASPDHLLSLHRLHVLGGRPKVSLQEHRLATLSRGPAAPFVEVDVHRSRPGRRTQPAAARPGSWRGCLAIDPALEVAVAGEHRHRRPRSFLWIVALIAFSSSSGPELPMRVVQP